MQRLFIFIALAGAIGCDDAPKPKGDIAGAIDGFVHVTAAVGGVTVTAFEYDPSTGHQGAQIAQSAPTTNDGGFHLELGAYSGPLVLSARGAGGSYTEPATGIVVPWTAGNELRGAIIKGGVGSFSFSVNAGDHVVAIVSPWSDLAWNYGAARLAHHRDPDFTTSLDKAHQLFREHLEFDFWSVVPADLTSGGMRAIDASSQAGAELAGLSMLVKLTDDELQTQGHSSLQLEELLRRDVGGGYRDPTANGNCAPSMVSDTAWFDGCDATGSVLALGRCPAPPDMGCRYTPLTSLSLRRDFSYAVGSFLGLPMRNESGIQVGAMNDLLQRIDGRESELFPGPGDHSFDVTPPSVSVVETTMDDETNVTADVVDTDPFNTPWGTVRYGGSQQTVALNGSTTVQFGKYASLYTPGSRNLPRWHFMVADNRSTGALIQMEARPLLQDASGNFVALTSFAPVSSVSGAGYNRELVIDTSLSPVVGVRSGTYKVEYRAADEVGNLSTVQTVQWTEHILPPPVRQRAGSACGGTDSNCAARYCLGDSGCAQPNAAQIPINASRLHVANAWIDNPNSVPVRVQLVVFGCVGLRAGRTWQHPVIMTNATAQPVCDQICHSTPGCYEADTDPEEIVGGVVSLGGIEGSVQTGGSATEPLPACPTCGENEIEIPATSSANIWLDATGYHSAFPSAPGPIPPFTSSDPASWPSTPFVTGALGSIWQEFALNQFMNCVSLRKHQAVHFITRILATPFVSVSLNARPAAPPMGIDDEPPTRARGTNFNQFAYTPSPWSTAETGFTPFPPMSPSNCGGGGGGSP